LLVVGAVDSLWLEHLWLEPKQTRDLSVIYQTTKNGVLAVELDVKLSVVHPCYDFAWSVSQRQTKNSGKIERVCTSLFPVWHFAVSDQVD
jgi:hypothetical protein